MTGKVIGFYENTATIEIQDSYELSLNEQVEIESLKMSHFRELQCLYWVLIGYVAEDDRYKKLPKADIIYFNDADNAGTLYEKIYCLVRWRTNYIITSYNIEGKPEYRPRSVSAAESTQRALSEHFDEAIRYFGRWIEFKQFWTDNSEARQRLGKE